MPASTLPTGLTSRRNSRPCTGSCHESLRRLPCVRRMAHGRGPGHSSTTGSFSRWHACSPIKNLDRIFEVFAKRPDLDLVVVGSGRLDKVLRESAPSNVDLVGNVSDPELRWLYGHCAALIPPAFEDYGLTPLEAASFGKPTLALKRGGTWKPSSKACLATSSRIWTSRRSQERSTIWGKILWTATRSATTQRGSPRSG